MKYRYGFNGKENDNEVKGQGNSIDFGARIYDPRLGRFLSTDPKESEYAFQSTYVCAQNNPIALIDVNGEGVPGMKDNTASEGQKDACGKTIYSCGTSQNNYEDEGWVKAEEYKDRMFKAVRDQYNYDHPYTYGMHGYTPVKPDSPYDIVNNTFSKDFIDIYNEIAPEAIQRELSSRTYGSGRIDAHYVEFDLALLYATDGFSSILKKGASQGPYINLASSTRTAHIIGGDATGGGHAWFGSLKSFINGITREKSMFPASWSNDKIMHAISDVTVNNPWVQQTGKAGATVTKSGMPVRYSIEGTYQGVKIKVITTATDIITAFPIK